jgi:hypothetical protein
MPYFSRFIGDDNEELFKLQQSIWFGRGNNSVIYQFLEGSILHYRNCSQSIDLIDPITIILNRGCIFYNYLFVPFIEVISAYYRYIWGCQHHIPFPDYGVPQTEDEWVSHFRKFVVKEGVNFSKSHSFFPNIIHLIVIQNLPYALDLQKHLLLMTSRICNTHIQNLYNREIPFLRDKKLKILEEHEKRFEMLYRSEIINLIEKQKKDNNSEFLAIQ